MGERQKRMDKIRTLLPLAIAIIVVGLSIPTGSAFILRVPADRAPSTTPAATATSSLSATISDEWSEFSIHPGHAVDEEYMIIVGSDYSPHHPKTTVIETSKPGMRFGNTLVERAEVIVSRGTEPLMPGEEPPPTFELGENEYIVNRGTRVDKNRMYVMDFMPSEYREGGVVLRTVNPGVVDEFGNNVQLAEVIASSGKDGKWRPPKPAMEGIEPSTGGGTGSGTGGAFGASSGGPDDTTRSRGMVAFSSVGTFGFARNGANREEPGYTYGPGTASG
mmetsp:Transcript_16858/g.37356  ORF Transcript_16858/g.37356 Transcript_16858/m.37356 type:complete len:277 (+) Transcript_16858:248-1078(+)